MNRLGGGASACDAIRAARPRRSPPKIVIPPGSGIVRLFDPKLRFEFKGTQRSAENSAPDCSWK